jgi:hypothetical protein
MGSRHSCSEDLSRSLDRDLEREPPLHHQPRRLTADDHRERGALAVGASFAGELNPPLNPLPKIYVFCNGCSPAWHNFVAIAEDGTGLAGHVCSAHGYAAHDMGVNENGWKRDIYAAHYPDGFEVVYVEVRGTDDLQAHPGLAAAAMKNSARGRVISAYRELHGSDPTEEFIRDAAAKLLAEEGGVA